MADWLPKKDGELLPFATNMSAKIGAAPTTYGLVAADATALAALVTSFTSLLATANNPSTRTKTAIANKDLGKAQLSATIRSFAKRIQANPSVTVGQKTDLGLPIHAVTPSPLPPPTTYPVVNLVESRDATMTIRLADVATPTKRARPEGTIGAEVYSFIPAAPGATPPSDLELWRFEGLATKSEFEVDFPAEDAGKSALIIARWINRKGEVGPKSDPLNGNIAA